MKSGATMSLEYRIAAISGTDINSLYFNTLSDNVLEVRESGVSVLDYILKNIQKINTMCYKQYIYIQ